MKTAHKRYDSKYKVTRIFLADYLLLKEFSQRAGVSMSEALHKIITREDHKAPVPPTQTRLPIELIALSTPVTSARQRLIPVTRARSTPITVSFSREVEHINGHKRTD